MFMSLDHRDGNYNCTAFGSLVNIMESLDNNMFLSHMA